MFKRHVWSVGQYECRNRLISFRVLECFNVLQPNMITLTFVIPCQMQKKPTLSIDVMYDPSLVSSGIVLLSPGKQKRYLNDLHIKEGETGSRQKKKERTDSLSSSAP